MAKSKLVRPLLRHGNIPPHMQTNIADSRLCCITIFRDNTEENVGLIILTSAGRLLSKQESSLENKYTPSCREHVVPSSQYTDTRLWH